MTATSSADMSRPSTYRPCILLFRKIQNSPNNPNYGTLLYRTWLKQDGPREQAIGMAQGAYQGGRMVARAQCLPARPTPSSRSAIITTPMCNPLSTAIGLGKYRIPSDLRSQAGYRLASTTVGDHVGILGAVVILFVMMKMLTFRNREHLLLSAEPKAESFPSSGENSPGPSLWGVSQTASTLLGFGRKSSPGSLPEDKSHIQSLTGLHADSTGPSCVQENESSSEYPSPSREKSPGPSSGEERSHTSSHPQASSGTPPVHHV